MKTALETDKWDDYTGSLVGVYLIPLLFAIFFIIMFAFECIQCGCQSACLWLKRDI